MADFEIDGRLGRCSLCHTPEGGSAWTKLGNLRAHEKLKTHKDNVAQAQLRASQGAQAGVPAGTRRRYQAYVEDCPDLSAPNHSIPWFSTPTFDDFSFETSPLDANEPTTRPPEQRATDSVRGLPLDMQDALSGGVNFSSADMPSLHGTSEITLEDVLSGAGLLEAVMSVEQDERPPPPSMMSDPGWEPEYDEFASPGEYYICDWGRLL